MNEKTVLFLEKHRYLDTAAPRCPATEFSPDTALRIVALALGYAVLDARAGFSEKARSVTEDALAARDDILALLDKFARPRR